MQNGHVPGRKIGSATVIRLMTLVQQLADEYGTVSDPQLIAQISEFADVLDSELRDQCQVPLQYRQILDQTDTRLLAHWNIGAKPFTWTATADEILAKVRLVETNIKKLVDNNAK